MKLSGNKGEWSELYVLLKLLSTGELYAADEKLQKIKDVYYPILKIIRQEDENKHLEYVIVSEEQGIEIHWNAEIIRSITQKEMAKRAAYLYEKIVEGGSRAFEIPGSDTIMNELACTKISAPSTDKTDITMQIHDINTGYEPICGFSIKSELGSAPTLLNASGATNFVYEVSGISDELAEQINAIDSKTKILDRIQMITENGTMKYSHMKNKVFSGNLMLIDTYMEEIIAHLLLLYYQNQATDSDKLIRIIEEQNPLGYPRKGIYAYKFKKFLCSIALGMMPSKEWDGHDEANGGYVIVKDNGAGMSQDKLDELSKPQRKLSSMERGEHIGIKNIKERLDYIYENKYRFQIWSKEGEGTIVTIRIPAIVSSETEK